MVARSSLVWVHLEQGHYDSPLECTARLHSNSLEQQSMPTYEQMLMTVSTVLTHD